MKNRVLATLFPLVLALPLPINAAQVQLYGVVDMGFSMARASGNGPEAADGSWSYAMKSGMRNSSRIGLRGVEEVGTSGIKVGFILENQFKADSGEFQSANTLWERESSLWMSGDWGKVTVGRLGKLRSPVGSTGLFTTNNVNPFGNAMSSFVGGHKTVTVGDYFPHNNSIVYAAPKIQGLELFAQYSFGDKDDAGEMDDNDRYMALAARYFSGPLKATVVFDTIDKAHASDCAEQPSTVTAAVNYDFGVVQPFLLVQYFHSSPLNSVGFDAQRGYMKARGNYSGFGGMLTLRSPLAGGLAKAGVGYMKAKPEDKGIGNDLTRLTFSVGYDYKISKTFDLYMDAGYIQQRSETSTGVWILRGTEVLFGCVKFF